MAMTIDRDDDQPQTEDQARRSAWIPWAFVGFFLVVLSVNSVMIYVAFDSWTGLWGQGGSRYQQGLAYNDRLEAVAEQHARGWTVAHGFERTGQRTGALWISLSDDYDNALSRGVAVARIVRPTHTGHDFDVTLSPDGSGRYAADVAFPLSGQWEVDFRFSHERGDYRLTDRIYVR